MTLPSRYKIFGLLIVFCILRYVKVNPHLFSSENFEARQVSKAMLTTLRRKMNQSKYTQSPSAHTEQEQNNSITVNENDHEVLVKRRVEFTRQVCEEKQFENVYTEFKFKDIGHMLVDEKNKFIFCYIPKVSCSTWKKVISKLYRTHRQGYKNLHMYSTEGIKYRLKNYRRAMFVRDPITRFLSAYLHKFYTARNSTIRIWERAYGTKMIQRYRPWMHIEGQRRLNITVSEFIKYIVELGEDYRIDALRDHWLPMYRSCDPCKFKPEFIGHFENLETEGPYLLEWLGVSDVEFPEYHASDAATKLVNSYQYAEMGLMRALRSYYHRDYELFNYSANETMRKVLFGE